MKSAFLSLTRPRTSARTSSLPDSGWPPGRPPYVSVDELYRAVDDYIFWYNNTRLQNDSRA
ncbi:MAG: IS3 family transposase [Schaalia turicensis]